MEETDMTGSNWRDNDEDDDIALSGLDLIFARYYSSGVLCFRPRPDVSHADVIKVLQGGIEATCCKVPIFTSRVFEKPPSPQQPAEGQRELREDPDWIPQVTLNDLTHTSLDYDELEDAAFPPTYFDADRLMPQGSASSTGFAPPTGAPAVVAQANFINGGLLLAIRVHHAVADGTGFALFLKHWAWHTKLFQEASSGNPDVSLGTASHNRSVLHRYWKSQNKPIADSSDATQWRRLGLWPSSGLTALPLPHPDIEARVFYMSANSFDALTSEGQKGDGSRVNGNDVLSALLWRATIRARKENSTSPANTEYANSNSTTLDAVVNGRAFVGSTIPYDYIANMVLFASPTMTVGELLDDNTTLATISETVHKAANGISMEQALAAYGLATTISDYRYMPFVFGSMAGTEVFINSWMALQATDVNFGNILLNNGCSDCIRPLVFEYGGYARRVVVLPKTSQGGLEIFVEMLAGEIQALQLDEEFTKYVQLMC